ncbi:MAG: alkaline shock response membrane anchor protein AmaP [Tissierellia bacterium]|nr:alkaline shock response membrane anchor protein AmaP [Tissierellia bacterium]
MSVFDRILLILVSILLALFSILIILFPIESPDIISLYYANNLLRLMKGNYLFMGIGIILLLISIRLIVVNIKAKERQSKSHYIIQRTDHGEINISSETIIGLAQSVADKFVGVRNVKTNVDIIEDQLFIDLKGEVTPEINIPETIEELQNKVKEHVESCTGVNVNEIRVIITNVTAPVRNIK